MKRQFFDRRENRMWIAARDLPSLANRGLREGGGIERLPGFNDNDAILFMDKDGESEVWVNPAYKGYRMAYGAMLRLMYDYNYELRELDGLNIDHIYSKVSALNRKIRYVRLAAIAEDINKGRARFEERLGTPLNKSLGLASATVMDYCKVNNCPLLLGSKGMENDGVSMMIAVGVDQGFIPRERASQLIALGMSQVKQAFS